MGINEIIKNIRNISFFILILIMILGFVYNSPFLINKGFRFIRKGKYKNAIEEFRKKIEKKPNSWRLYYGLAYCYFMLGFSRNSMEYFKKTLELQKNKTYIYSEIAILHAEIEKDIESAKKYIEKSRLVDSQKIFLFRNPDYFFNEIQGRIHFLENDLISAQKYYEKAIPKIEKTLIKLKNKKIEKITTLYYRLGFYYLWKNENGNAIKCFKSVMQISGESYFAEKSQEQLNRIEKGSF